jgi:hypothetical protein
MYTQLDFKVMSKRNKKEERPSNFHEFWSEEVPIKQAPSKREL